MVSFFTPEGERMAYREVARWANKVHRQIAKGKGSPFSTEDFNPAPFQGYGSRIKGHMCNCGVDQHGFTNGSFKLLTFDDQSVVEGQKAYMICQNCGCYSHL